MTNTQTHSPECATNKPNVYPQYSCDCGLSPKFNCGCSHFGPFSCSCICHQQTNGTVQQVTKSEAKRLFIQNGKIPNDVNEATKKIMEEYAGTFTALAESDKEPSELTKEKFMELYRRIGERNTPKNIDEFIGYFDKQNRDAVADAWYKTGYQAGKVDTISSVRALIGNEKLKCLPDESAKCEHVVAILNEIIDKINLW